MIQLLRSYRPSAAWLSFEDIFRSLYSRLSETSSVAAMEDVPELKRGDTSASDIEKKSVNAVVVEEEAVQFDEDLGPVKVIEKAEEVALEVKL